ncbi:unnamed protein product, partial [Phaeothamnion confervicola]
GATGAAGAGGGGGPGSRRGSAASSVMSRRNSTSTLYVGPHDTMSDPDRDATIRCVCAVYRAHITEAV